MRIHKILLSGRVTYVMIKKFEKSEKLWLPLLFLLDKALIPMNEHLLLSAACGVCMKARGVDSLELMDKVKTGTMELALAWVKESDKQLCF